ncbi:APC family permease [Ktedonospora formicarum]|uniref:Amino acid permease n=1 Tax=Ktedonospora formicarum TaxID=2778364 RepID=A0A8J3MTH9_9CHLR|nr:APC family permease [Ktedonospora formicarum]GHO48252.1 hypothetical protein KSX_64150 [Ktedonospora formicarum]
MKRWQIQPLASEDYTRKALPQKTGNFDMMMSFMMIMFFISNPVGTIAAGPVSFVYWGIGALIFFIPCVVAVAQLGRMFPHEGSTYNWTHKALGGFWSLFASISFWVPGVLATVGSASIGLTFIQGLHPGWLAEPWQQAVVLVVIFLFACVLALRPMRLLQNMVNIATLLTYGIVVLLGVAAVVWIATGHASATHFATPDSWTIKPDNFALFGSVILAYLGADVPIIMAGETNEKYRTGRPLLWGCIFVLGAYFLVTMALMVLQGPNIVNLGNFSIIGSIDMVFGHTVGNIAATCIIIFFPIFVALDQSLFARLLMVTSIDRRLPISLSKLNKHRVPSNAIIFQTVIAIVFTLVLFLSPYVIPIANPAELGANVQAVSLATLVLVWAVSTIFLFVDLIVLYFKDRVWFRAHQVIPSVILWGSVVIAPIASVVAIVVTLNYSQALTIPNDQWRLLVAALTVVSLVASAIGSIFATSEASWQDQVQEAEM